MKDWRDIKLHFLDFEGGVGTGVIEYGYVTLLNGKIQETQTGFCKPICSVPEIEFRQHGISDTFLKDETEFFSEKFIEFAELRESGLFGAHHASVESNFIKRVWAYPRKSPDFLDGDPSYFSWGPWVDTYKLFLNTCPGLESYKLSDLINYFKLSETLEDLGARYCSSRRKKYHCALYDAIASALLFMALIELKKSEKITLRWLLANSCSQSKKQADFQQMDLF